MLCGCVSCPCVFCLCAGDIKGDIFSSELVGLTLSLQYSFLLKTMAWLDTFMPQYDRDLAQQVSEAEASGGCLHFVDKPAALACIVCAMLCPINTLCSSCLSMIQTWHIKAFGECLHFVAKPAAFS